MKGEKNFKDSLKAHATFKQTGTFICLFTCSRQHFLRWAISYSPKFISFSLKWKAKLVRTTATTLKSLFGQNSRLCKNVKVENPASTS